MLRIFDPKSREIVNAGEPRIFFGGEAGLLGLALDRDFAKTLWLYLFFSPAEKTNTFRLSRFTLKDGRLDLGSEKLLFDYPSEDAKLNHQGGGLFMAENGDALSYEWKFGDAGTSREIAPVFVFEKPGTHSVTLTVTDSHGASSTAQLEIRVGNAPPQVTLLAPLNGSFYDPGQKIPYRIAVTDAEDGSTDNGIIPPARVLLSARTSLHATMDETTMHPGLKLMRATTCFACHITTDKNVGPPYIEVARKYQSDPTARERLAQKFIAGGIGVWGKDVPMPPHPQHTLEQTRQMVDWVLAPAPNRLLDVNWIGFQNQPPPATIPCK